MRINSFADYLYYEVHTRLFNNLLDDDIPDHYEDWLAELDPMEVIDYAEEYIKTLKGVDNEQ